MRVLTLILITLVPGLELRASIPYGILQGYPPVAVYVLCCAVNVLLGLVLFAVVRRLSAWLAARWAWYGRFYQRQLLRAQKRVHKHVERWGWLGLAAFIAIPLPGSGVYTGTLAAYALGFSYERLGLAVLLGVAVAGLVVTLASLGVTLI